MKTFAIKTTLAACLLAPMMAMASDSGSESFSDTADQSFKLDGIGFTTVTASWTDLSAALEESGITQQFQANSLVWKLLNKDDKLKLSGSFTDGVGNNDFGNIVLDESQLGKGEYKIKFVGLWDVNGKKSKWETKIEERVYLSEPVRSSVSPVPEPETYAMLLAGLALVATIAIRRKKSDAA